ncbi:MAG: hypothetical protein ACQCN4_04375 [Candidatus Bathyarchaeia archaeon]
MKGTLLANKPLDQAIRGDWGSACSAAGRLMMETLQFDGFANGLMGNIKPGKTQDACKRLLRRDERVF